MGKSIVATLELDSPGLNEFEGKLNRQERQANQLFEGIAILPYELLGALGGSNEVSAGQSLRRFAGGVMIWWLIVSV